MILAVEEVADRFAASLVHFAVSLALIGAYAGLGDRICFFGDAALRTAIGETGLIRLQLELFGADSTDFDRKRHTDFMIMESADHGSASSYRVTQAQAILKSVEGRFAAWRNLSTD